MAIPGKRWVRRRLNRECRRGRGRCHGSIRADAPGGSARDEASRIPSRSGDAEKTQHATAAR